MSDNFNPMDNARGKKRHESAQPSATLLITAAASTALEDVVIIENGRPKFAGTYAGVTKALKSALRDGVLIVNNTGNREIDDLLQELMEQVAVEHHQATPPQTTAEQQAAQPTNAGVESDPLGKSQHEHGAKLDAGKPLPWLCMSGFARALTDVVNVTTTGAAKYSPSGWEHVPDGAHRYMEAFGRHTMALARGETRDSDTGCRHKTQMIWNLLASLELELRNEGRV